MISITAAQAKLRTFLDMAIYDHHNVNGVACTHHPALLANPLENILNSSYYLLQGGGQPVKYHEPNLIKTNLCLQVQI